MFYALVTVGFQVSNYYWEVSIFPFNSVNVSLFQESAVRCTYVYAWYPLLMNWLINKNAHLLKLFVLQLVFSIIIRAAPAYFWLLFVWNVSLHSLTFFLFVSFGWMVVSYKHHLVESLVVSSIFSIYNAPGRFQFSSVTRSCPTLWDPINCSMPGCPVHHHLLKLAQTHGHRVGDAIQLSHPMSSLTLLPSIFPSIRVFSKKSDFHIRWPKY